MPIRVAEFQGLDEGRHVLADHLPVLDLALFAAPVAALLQGDCVAAAQRLDDAIPDAPVEAGGVNEQQRRCARLRPIALKIGQLHAVDADFAELGFGHGGLLFVCAACYQCRPRRSDTPPNAFGHSHFGARARCPRSRERVSFRSEGKMPSIRGASLMSERGHLALDPGSESHVGARASCPRIEQRDLGGQFEGGTPSLRGVSPDTTKKP